MTAEVCQTPGPIVLAAVVTSGMSDRLQVAERKGRSLIFERDPASGPGEQARILAAIRVGETLAHLVSSVA